MRFVIALVLVAFCAEARAQVLTEPGVTRVAHVGNITIAFVTAESASPQKYLTLEEGLLTGEAVIHERNSQTLWIDNLSKSDLFVQSGDLIKGGQQDRMIAYDQILDPGDTLQEFTVFCIEAGRSTKRGDEPLETFSASNFSAPLPHLRAMAQHELTAKLLVPKVGGLTAPDDEQLRMLELLSGSNPSPFNQQDPAQISIWNDVAQMQSHLTARLHDSVTKNASKTSLQLALERAESNDAMHHLRREIDKVDVPSDAIGFVYAIGGAIQGGDLYGSHELFAQMWPKLSRSVGMQGVASDSLSGSVTEQQFVQYLDQAKEGREAATHSNARTEIHVWETPATYLFETRDRKHPNEGWLHRQYVTRESF